MRGTRPSAALLLLATALIGVAAERAEAAGAGVGRIERLDPRFDALVPEGAALAVVVDGT